MVLSIVNNTTTPLAGSGVFVGTFEDTRNYSSVLVSVATNTDSTLLIQYSQDETNVDFTETIAVNSSINFAYARSFEIKARFVRMQITNNASSTQSFLRLTTRYNLVDGDLNNTQDDVLVYGNDGTANRKMKTDSNGNLQVNVLTMPAITVSAVDMDVRDLSNAQDNILVYGNDGTANKKLKTDANGNLQVGIISATDVDIRNLSNTQDNLLAYGFDGTNNQKIKTNTAGNLQVDITSAPNLNIRSLVNSTDNLLVYGFDGTNNQKIKTDSDGKIITTQSTASVYSNISVTTTGSVIKATPGYLSSITASNISGFVYYLRIYNKATQPSVSDDSSSLIMTIPIMNVSTYVITYEAPIYLNCGIAIRATKKVASGDATAVVANDLIVNITYY